MKRLILYDLKVGIWGNWPKYLLMFVLSLTGSWGFEKEYLACLEYEVVSGQASIWDYLSHIFWGIVPLSRDRDLTGNLPMLWILIMLIITLTVGYYLHQQSYEFGRNIMAKSGNRTIWWLAKCIWCSVSVLLCISSLLLGILCCGFFHEISWGGVNWDLIWMAKGTKGEMISDGMSILLVAVIPIVIISAIALWQQVLSLIFQPIVSLLLIIAYYCF